MLIFDWPMLNGVSTYSNYAVRVAFIKKTVGKFVLKSIKKWTSNVSSNYVLPLNIIQYMATGTVGIKQVG
jgi:hypothetical protein